MAGADIVLAAVLSLAATGAILLARALLSAWLWRRKMRAVLRAGKGRFWNP